MPASVMQGRREWRALVCLTHYREKGRLYNEEVFVERWEMSDLKLTSNELHSAIDHLVKANRLLQHCRESVRKGFFMGDTVQDDLRDAWYQVNCCRLYTETSVDFENYTQTAMGNIVDAKEMIDSLVHWGKGLTPYGGLSIVLACSEAMSNITVVQAELEHMLSGQISTSEFSEAVFAAIGM